VGILLIDSGAAGRQLSCWRGRFLSEQTCWELTLVIGNEAVKFEGGGFYSGELSREIYKEIQLVPILLYNYVLLLCIYSRMVVGSGMSREVLGNWLSLGLRPEMREITYAW
jgi:hypothetical protein